MTDPSPFDSVPTLLRGPMEARGFSQLTAVQKAVLDPALEGRDLRISSQTGSGKTVAIGFLIAPLCDGNAPRGKCTPRAVIIAPTRELATQVANELQWLLAPTGARVRSVVGGTSVRGEQRALAEGAEVLVGTPGRMLDHLSQGAVDPSGVRAVVLDEADQMLDLGFREELTGILEKMPEERRTVMASATFSPAVVALARRFQKDAQHVQGTAAGRAHEDIDHVVHPVPFPQLLDGIVNVLLMDPDELTLLFVRTRADAAAMAARLAALGFDAAALTGEMEQKERTRVMNAFRAGRVRVLVATDVAARGIDVPELGRVIQADPPTDGEVYTHRSGRTGRAGRKGTSITLVPPQARGRVERILRALHVEVRVAPVPTAADIVAAADARLVEELGQPPAPGGEDAFNPHLHELALRLLAVVDAPTLVHRLLSRLNHGPTTPRVVNVPPPPPPRVTPSPRPEGAAARPDRNRPFVAFRITWGEKRGADPRRLLALVCRRGGIRGTDVGAIRVGTQNSTFEVAADVAEQFAVNAARPDPRDSRIEIAPLDERFMQEQRAAVAPAPTAPAPREHPPAPRREHAHPRAARAPATREPHRPAEAPRPPREHAPVRPHPPKPEPARSAPKTTAAEGAPAEAKRKKPRWTEAQKREAAKKRGATDGGHAPPRKRP